MKILPPVSRELIETGGGGGGGRKNITDIIKSQLLYSTGLGNLSILEYLGM